MTRDELLANLREARHLVVGTAPTISRFRETIDEAIRVIEQQAGRRFPIQGEARCVPEGTNRPMRQLPPLTVPWSVAEAAYAVYSKLYGTSQSLERLAERGGFGRDEILLLLDGCISDA
jgi:hypothetical protein